jgi:hypothetical protein
MKLKMFFCALCMTYAMQGMQDCLPENKQYWIVRRCMEIFFPDPLHVRYMREYSNLSKTACSKLFDGRLKDSVLGKNGLPEAFVVATAFKLMSKKESLKLEKMYALGQSMSYYIMVARILEQLFGGNPDQYEFLAFSGRFYCSKCHEWALDNPEKSHKISVPQGWAGERLVDAYFHKDRLFPHESVIGHYYDYAYQEGLFDCKKVGVCDQIEYGDGMMSFLKVMEAVGKISGSQKLAQMKLLCIDVDMGSSAGQKSKIAYDAIDNFTWKDRPEVMGELDASGDDMQQNRLVPTYSFKEWSVVDPRSFEPHEDARVRMFAIMHHIIQNKDVYAQQFKDLVNASKK